MSKFLLYFFFFFTYTIPPYTVLKVHVIDDHDDDDSSCLTYAPRMCSTCKNASGLFDIPLSFVICNKKCATCDKSVAVTLNPFFRWFLQLFLCNYAISSVRFTINKFLIEHPCWQKIIFYNEGYFGLKKNIVIFSILHRVKMLLSTGICNVNNNVGSMEKQIR